MYEEARLAIQIVSAALCFILLRYMIKPYILTKEEQYLGLPMGFGFLGVTEVLLAIGIIFPITNLGLISLIMRTFSFVFIAFTYFFSTKPSKFGRFVWIIPLSSIIVGIATVCLYIIREPLSVTGISTSLGFLLRLLGLLCLSYVCINTLRSHIKNLEPTTIRIPLGFIMLAISQYSQLIRVADSNYLYGVSFIGGIIARFIGLAIFVGAVF